VNESMETTIPGIFACGNVVQVHDLVDWVTEESRRAGHNAARFTQGQLTDLTADLNTRAGKGIRYVVPHTIRTGNLEKEVDLMMRVTDPFKNKYLTVRHGETIVKKVRKVHLTPGEMESIKIPVEKLHGLTGELTVSLEEVAHEA
jgi:hypothetical protein